MKYKDEVHELERALLVLDSDAARRVVERLPRDAAFLPTAERVVVAALESLGLQWERGVVALSQVYMGGRICEELLDALLPPGDPGRLRRPKIAVAVLADHHLLGKRIVSSALRAAGYDLLDYGGGLGPRELAERAGRDGIEVLLVSTLMLSSALQVRDLVGRLGAAGAATKVLVGGAPFLFDDQLWRAVGADAMGRNATDAVRLVEKLAGTAP